MKHHKHLFVLFFLSLNSGIPFLLTLSTLSFWLSEVALSSFGIGLMTISTLPYCFKFLLSPLVDHLNPFKTRLNASQSWILIALIGEVISMILLGMHQPSLLKTMGLATLLSFFASIHDIIVDQFRMRLKLNASSSCAIESIGFKTGMLISGAGTLYLASMFSWKTAYLFMIIFPLLTVCLIPFIHHPSHGLPKHKFLSFNIPFLSVLLLVCFKGIDSILQTMSAPFLYSLSISKIEYANLTKVWGIIMMILGGGMGGVFIHRLGLVKSIYIALLCQGLASLCFYGLTMHPMMTFAISVENFSSGLTGTVFLAYVSSFCKTHGLAFHFTLLYSLGSLGRIVFSSLSGWIVSSFGWSVLFLSETLLIPILMVAVPKERLAQALKENLKKRKKKKPTQPSTLQPKKGALTCFKEHL